jgi:hypothetical protein
MQPKKKKEKKILLPAGLSKSVAYTVVITMDNTIWTPLEESGQTNK